jgi:hypothetical protein
MRAWLFVSRAAAQLHWLLQQELSFECRFFKYLPHQDIQGTVNILSATVSVHYGAACVV